MGRQVSEDPRSRPRIVAGRPRPKFSWNFEPDGSIQVKAETLPSAAVLWQAANPIVRDFRLEGIGSAYRSSLNEADAIVIELGREIFGARKVASAIFARSSQQFGRRARAHPYQDFS